MLNRPPATDSGSEPQSALDAAMARLAQGDRTALRTVYDASAAKLFAICLRILRDRSEAEDALQDVYVNLWRRADRFDASRASAIAWLSSFARNRAIDRLRSGRVLRQSGSIDEAASVADLQPLPDRQAEDAQESARIHHCLDELEDQQREPIRRAFFEGLTYAELATKSGTPLGTMKSRIRRGLTRLKACLES
ncbi:sigma-70 family RNA polymerase sigma factor [Porphyrobacter algicida]|uniref:Sigma-70 family RNA polymerase sigma factor n=1 Tax=Qipengyuania algicida TaxID=1836209 RepID=A0A845AH46_9SPHN|nr:sigma-70 family RNA polymerase sigma factor [Qipengyuania algicida]MXP29942.1 sigma-70 family RNA polymerase sigma factor [Qipengyuania algicida]